MDIEAVRKQFPAFEQQVKGRTPIFLDNPAGTQVPQGVIDAVSHYYRHNNANSGGVFPTSRRTDALKQSARETLAAFLNASRPTEIAFGPNMTTLTYIFSRAFGRGLQAGDEIVVSQIDHDANITPWVQMAEDRGLTVRWVRLDTETGMLDLDSYQAALNAKTKLVCVGHAANALGTINPIQEMAKLAHESGAQIYVDAVQSAPHLSIDVQKLDVDYLVCSAYKFFGPHIGVLYGKYNLMKNITPYKVRPAPQRPPGKWETGTASYETIAGTQAAVQYLASLGDGDNLREQLVSAYARIREHENELVWHLIGKLKALPGIELRGVVDPEQAALRVPTFVFRIKDKTPQQVAKALAKEAIYVWDGHYYAVETMKALGYEDGMVRIGIAHYNTKEEMDRTAEVLSKICDQQ